MNLALIDELLNGSIRNFSKHTMFKRKKVLKDEMRVKFFMVVGFLFLINVIQYKGV